tara:strand:- start:208 stop:1347 length:1140 start_codon:yes stop_codon:yes gene_type:complete
MSIKRYEAVFDPTKKNVYSISLVEDPAMQSMFIALKAQDKPTLQIQLAEVDKKERTLLGVVLIPDKDIYRKDQESGEEFYITFSKETIKESAHNFFTSGYQLNSKLQHEKPIEGISFCESWIVRDPKNDTANAYNLPKGDIVEGSWIVKMKCENDEIYQAALNGEINGFSIDGLFDIQELNLKSNIEMAEEVEKKSFLDQLKVMFAEVGLVKKEETKIELTHEILLGMVQSGDVTIEYDGEVLEAGVALFVMQGEEKISLPDGEYPSDAGNLVVADGVLVEVKAEVEAGTEAPAAAPAAPSVDAIKQEIKSLLVKFSEDMDSKIESIKSELVEFKKENVTLKAEVLELSKQPAAKSVKTEVKQVELTKAGRILAKIRQN